MQGPTVIIGCNGAGCERIFCANTWQGWHRLKIQIVHLIESYSLLWEIETVNGVIPVNTAYGTWVVSAHGFVVRLRGWIKLDNRYIGVNIKHLHVFLYCW